MKRKLLSVLFAAIFVIAGAMGITTAFAEEVTPITVDAVGMDSSWNTPYIQTSSSNTENILANNELAFGKIHVLDENGNQLDLWCIYTLGNGLRLFVHKPDGSGANMALSDYKYGYQLVIDAGCGFVGNEVIQEGVTYSYNGSAWVLGELDPVDPVDPIDPVEKVAAIKDVNYTNYAGFAGYCIALNFGGTTGADWAQIQDAQGQYVTLTDKDGNEKAVTLVETQGDYVMINRNSYTFAEGDRITVKAGFTVDCGTVKEDITYVGTSSNAPWSVYDPSTEVEEVELKLAFVNGTPDVNIDLDGTWGFTSTVLLGFDTSNWGGDLGQYANVLAGNEDKIALYGATGAKLELVDVTYVQQGHFVVRTKEVMLPGSKIVINAGFAFTIGNVRATLAQDYTFVCISASDHTMPLFNESMVPTSLEIVNGAEDKDLPVGAQTAIKWQIPEGTYGYPVFSVSDEEIATVNEKGEVLGVKEGAVTVTATMGELTASFEINVIPALDVQNIELVNGYTYYVIKGEEIKLPALKAHAVFEGGSKGTDFELNDENLTVPEINSEEVGETKYVLKVNYRGVEYDVDYTVNVYEPYELNITELGIVDWFSYALFIQYPNSTTNTANITDVSNVTDVVNKIKYTRADGTELPTPGYYVLGGGNIALFYFSGLDENNYNDYYLAGDVITMEAGLSAWKWTGALTTTETDNAAIVAGSGMYIKEAILKETVQYRYDGNVWGFYLEYTDFVANAEEKTVKLGESVNAGVSRVPANATSGTITYTSSDETVATVSARGVISGISEGSAVITATISGGTAGDISVNINVTVEDYITGLKFDKTELEFKVGDTFDVTALKAVLVYASGKEGEEVDLTDAVITGLDLEKENKGTVVITVTLEGKTYSGALKVTVTAAEPELEECGNCGSSMGVSSVIALGMLGIAGLLKRKNNR